VSTGWKRFFLSGVMPEPGDVSNYGVLIPAGASIEIFGPQVDAQTYPSAYVRSEHRSGVYANARFAMPELEIVATGPNQNACVVHVRANIPAGDSQ
jgi:hypothetical protein